MDRHQYFAADNEDAVERERIGLLERIFDPHTIRHLEALGVAQGWTCLEIGAGAGSVARWLAQRVGPGGRVVATDIDTRFLRGLDVPNLEVRQHDIVKDDLEEGEYDLVHCRALLMHLAEPEKGFARMASAVRRSGWLLIEEPDYGSEKAADPRHPLAEAYDAARRLGFESVRSIGLTDPYFGRRVRELVERAGFAEVGHEGVVDVHRGGEDAARLDSMTTQAVVPALAGTGTAEEQRARAQRVQVQQQAMEDPSFLFVGITAFAAWGRRAGQLRLH